MNGQNSGSGSSGSGWGPKNTNSSGSGSSGSGWGWGGHSEEVYNATYNEPRKIIVGGDKEWTYGFNYSDWASKTAPFFVNDILGEYFFSFFSFFFFSTQSDKLLNKIYIVCIKIVDIVCCQIHRYHYIVDIVDNINKFDGNISDIYVLSDCSVQIQSTSTIHAHRLLVF